MKVITAYRLCNVTDEDYCKYCKERSMNKKFMLSKKSFFYDILTGRLVRNSRTGKIEKHRVDRKRKLEW